VRDPLVESLVQGLSVEAEHIQDLRSFCKEWVRDRNRFDINRRRSGLFGRIEKDDADRLLKRQLAELDDGGAT
jgi:hypothetical protein